MMKRALGVMLAGAVLLVGWPAHVAAIATQPFTTLRGTSCVSASFCESVGVGPNNAGFYVPLAETWNGKSWTVQPTPNPAGAGYTSLQGVSCVSATFCEAVGGAQATGTQSTVAEVWNGASWAIQPTPNVAGTSDDYLESVSCLSVSFCEAVGVGGSSSTSSLAEEWDGTAWTIQPTPNPSNTAYNQLNGVSCVSMSFCEAVGQASAPGFAALGELWNGSSWVLQSMPNAPGATGYVQLQGVSCASASDCEAVGDVYTGTYSTLAEAWDGTSWALQASPNIAGGNTYFYGVSCVSASDCEAVGFETSAGGAVAALWNGTSWTLQSTATPSSFKSGATLFGVSCVSAVACEASGGGRHNSARVLPLTEGWNGTVWTAQ